MEEIVMGSGDPTDTSGDIAYIDTDTRLKLYRMMYECRVLEQRAYDLFMQNLVKGTSHLALGQEAVAAGRTAGPLAPLGHGAYTFFKNYCLKAGFLDGSAGLTVSVLSGVHAFVKYTKIRTMRNKNLKS